MKGTVIKKKEKKKKNDVEHSVGTGAGACTSQYTS